MYNGTIDLSIGF